MIKTSHAIIVTTITIFTLTWFYDGLLDKTYQRLSVLQKRVLELEDDCGHQTANKISFKVTVTTYNPTRQQCDSTPNITADGTKFKTWKATQYRYVALSRDWTNRVDILTTNSRFKYENITMYKYVGEDYLVTENSY